MDNGYYLTDASKDFTVKVDVPNLQPNSYYYYEFDLHSAWANNLPTNTYNPATGAGSAGVNFITNSITSSNHIIPSSLPDMYLVNPHIKFIQLEKHGYTLLDINKQRSQCHFYTVDNIDTSIYTQNLTAMFYVNNGKRHVNFALSEANAHPARYPNLIPCSIRGGATNIKRNSYSNLETVILTAYPNPFDDYINIQFSLRYYSEVRISLYNNLGQLINYKNIGGKSTGLLPNKKGKLDKTNSPFLY